MEYDFFVLLDRVVQQPDVVFGYKNNIITSVSSGPIVCEYPMSTIVLNQYGIMQPGQIVLLDSERAAGIIDYCDKAQSMHNYMNPDRNGKVTMEKLGLFRENRNFVSSAIEKYPNSKAYKQLSREVIEHYRSLNTVTWTNEVRNILKSQRP